jgi:hypothetical protein
VALLADYRANAWKGRGRRPLHAFQLGMATQAFDRETVPARKLLRARTSIGPRWTCTWEGRSRRGRF